MYCMILKRILLGFLLTVSLICTFSQALPLSTIVTQIADDKADPQFIFTTTTKSPFDKDIITSTTRPHVTSLGLLESSRQLLGRSVAKRNLGHPSSLGSVKQIAWLVHSSRKESLQTTVEIMKNGTVIASPGSENYPVHGKLSVRTVRTTGTGRAGESKPVVRIKGLESGLYLCMNEEGSTIGLASVIPGCEWVHTHRVRKATGHHFFYNSYFEGKRRKNRSRKKWFLSIHQGEVTKSTKQNARARFQLMSDTASDKEKPLFNFPYTPHQPGSPGRGGEPSGSPGSGGALPGVFSMSFHEMFLFDEFFNSEDDFFKVLLATGKRKLRHRQKKRSRRGGKLSSDGRKRRRKLQFLTDTSDSALSSLEKTDSSNSHSTESDQDSFLRKLDNELAALGRSHTNPTPKPQFSHLESGRTLSNSKT